MAKDQSAPEANSDDVLARGERLLREATAVLNQMQAALRVQKLRADGTCPIFLNDEVVYIGLPYVAFDQKQEVLAARHMPEEPEMIVQLVDLVRTLEGLTMIEVGAGTGCNAMFFRAFLKPAKTILIEPQKILRSGLEQTIAANTALPGTAELLEVIIDEDDAELKLGMSRPNRTHEARYLRREGGPLRGTSVDSLKLKKVGLIHFDFMNEKINALNGSAKTIERDRPMVLIDLSGRDLQEIRDFFEARDYSEAKMGRTRHLFLPN